MHGPSRSRTCCLIVTSESAQGSFSISLPEFEMQTLECISGGHQTEPPNLKARACCWENLTSAHVSDQTETSAILNPITLIDHRKSILKVDEQSLLPNYGDRAIIIEAGCGCHYWSNEIILLS